MYAAYLCFFSVWYEFFSARVRVSLHAVTAYPFNFGSCLQRARQDRSSHISRAAKDLLSLVFFCSNVTPAMGHKKPCAAVMLLTTLNFLWTWLGKKSIPPSSKRSVVKKKWFLVCQNTHDHLAAFHSALWELSSHSLAVLRAFPCSLGDNSVVSHSQNSLDKFI